MIGNNKYKVIKTHAVSYNRFWRSTEGDFYISGHRDEERNDAFVNALTYEAGAMQRMRGILFTRNRRLVSLIEQSCKDGVLNRTVKVFSATNGKDYHFFYGLNANTTFSVINSLARLYNLDSNTLDYSRAIINIAYYERPRIGLAKLIEYITSHTDEEIVYYAQSLGCSRDWINNIRNNASSRAKLIRFLHDLQNNLGELASDGCKSGMNITTLFEKYKNALVVVVLPANHEKVYREYFRAILSNYVGEFNIFIDGIYVNDRDDSLRTVVDAVLNHSDCVVGLCGQDVHELYDGDVPIGNQVIFSHAAPMQTQEYLQQFGEVYDKKTAMYEPLISSNDMRLAVLSRKSNRKIINTRKFVR